MPLTSTNFIAGKMNKSVDERLIPPGEYIDALNVRLGSTESTEIGAVENSLGNTILTQLEFQGVPLVGDIRTIGVYEDGINETLYWFVHNENNPNSVTTGVVDLIVSYNTNLGSLIYHVVSTSVLNFDFKYLITGVDKIENLLFFTDDLNSPRVINIKSDYAYPGPGAVDNVLEEEDVSVIVKPPGFEDFDAAGGQAAPLGAPHVELFALPGLSNAGGGIQSPNYMDTRFLSFAYRYRYQDGEYSATSLFTNPSFQPGTFKLSLQNFWNAGMENRFNGCNVTVSTGTKRVKEIDILYKQTTSNVIYVIKRYNKENLGIPDDSFYNIEFLNSEIYTTLGSDELLRLYDNVPRTAKAQTIQGNRLMYGNYVDQYDIRISPDGSKIPIVYHLDPQSKDITGEALPQATTSPGVYAFKGAHTEPDSVISFDLSQANPPSGAPITIGTTFTFSFGMQQTTATATSTGGSGTCGTTGLQTSPFQVGFNFTCPSNYADVNAMMNSQEFRNRIGGSLAQGYAGTSIVKPLYPCNESATGGTLSDKFYAIADDPMAGTTLELVSGGIGGTPLAPAVSCTPGVLDTNPFPIICSSTILLSGITLCDNTLPPCGGIGSNTCCAGQLTETGTDFGAVVPALVGGEIVIDSMTGLSASITAAPAPGDDFLLLTDIDGGLATLELSGTSYQIVSGGGVTTQSCLQDGFAYSVAGNVFSIQAPCTQYFGADGTAGGNWCNAIRYYNFIGYSSFASYLKSSNTQSLHSNRDYEVGIVYMDGEGRASTVLTSQNCTAFFDSSTSIYKNKIKVTLENLPPYWAKKYKFVVKPSQGTYQTVFSNLFYAQDGTATGATGLPIADANDPSQVWFKLDGQNQNVLKVGDELIVKQDSQGPVLGLAKTVVLAIQAYSGKGITNKSLSGLYMLLKPSGWTTESIDQAQIFYGSQSSINNFNSILNSMISGYSLNFSNGQPYDIPAGSTIRIKLETTRGGKNSCSRSIYYDRSFISTQDYGNFHQWAIGDDLQSKMFSTGGGTTTSAGVSSVNGMDLKFDPTLYTSAGAIQGSTTEWNAVFGIYTNAAGGMFAGYQAAITECTDWGGTFPGRGKMSIEVTRTGGVFVFETVPQDADPNLFYDASTLLDIEPELPGGQGYHMARREFDPTGAGSYSIASDGQDQTSAGANLITVLDAVNCYTFGNGVESYKIYDSPAGKGFNLGERTLAVSNQDFQEADRYAGMTYSGVYSSSANSNNLNEFNLGLANYKDLETTFGPIMKLHARETDILVLQEDRISYVLSGKNVITDSTGGGAIASVPQVLGTQIARIEEYGISFNPESFTSWGYDMFFTDTKRGAVINLRGASQGSDQLQVVSTYGMNSWFRDCFNAQLTTQKLGAYDPYMKEYVLGTNSQQIPMPLNEVPCGTTISQFNRTQSITYDVDLGLVIGDVVIDINISTGTVSVVIEWNGAVVASASTSSNTSLTFTKTFNTPQSCTVTLTPTGPSPIVPATYDVTVECPKGLPLTVRQIVVNSNNYNGQTIHTNYNWFDATNISPFTGFNPATLSTPDPAEYTTASGTQSLLAFPYNGSSVTMRTQKFGTDNFDFDPSMHKFRILASPTEYFANPNNPTSAEIATVVAAAPVVSGAVTSPSAGEYQAIQSGVNVSSVNNYLYLIWDLRLVSSGQLCYCSDPSTADEVCCNCEVPCDRVYFGPITSTFAQACQTEVNSPGNNGTWGFQGSGGLPVVGNVIFTSTSCDPADGYPPTGFYIVDPFATPSLSPKQWVEIGSNGVVLQAGTC